LSKVDFWGNIITFWSTPGALFTSHCVDYSPLHRVAHLLTYLQLSPISPGLCYPFQQELDDRHCTPAAYYPNGNTKLWSFNTICIRINSTARYSISRTYILQGHQCCVFSYSPLWLQSGCFFCIHVATCNIQQRVFVVQHHYRVAQKSKPLSRIIIESY